MTRRSRGEPQGSHFGPYAGSVLLHLALFGLFGVGWLTWKRATPPQPQTLAIEAVVVDPKTVPGLRVPQPEPKAEPAPAPAQPPAAEPPPVRDEVVERQRAEARQRAEDVRKAEETRKADEERKAREQRDAEAKRQAAEQRATDEKRKADEKRRADEKRKADEARQRAEREADLKRGLEAEERARAASGAGAQWRDLIRAKIMGEWRRPPTARPGVECIVRVTQVPGGEVVAARILSCNGDAAVRQSIELAVMNASPLPAPPDPALFERNLDVVFKPNE
jgi:colicin import membrane protein